MLLVVQELVVQLLVMRWQLLDLLLLRGHFLFDSLALILPLVQVLFHLHNLLLKLLVVFIEKRVLFLDWILLLFQEFDGFGHFSVVAPEFLRQVLQCLALLFELSLIHFAGLCHRLVLLQFLQNLPQPDRLFSKSFLLDLNFLELRVFHVLLKSIQLLSFGLDFLAKFFDFVLQVYAQQTVFIWQRFVDRLLAWVDVLNQFFILLDIFLQVEHLRLLLQILFSERVDHLFRFQEIIEDFFLVKLIDMLLKIVRFFI